MNKEIQAVWIENLMKTYPSEGARVHKLGMPKYRYYAEAPGLERDIRVYTFSGPIQDGLHILVPVEFESGMRYSNVWMLAEELPR